MSERNKLPMTATLVGRFAPLRCPACRHLVPLLTMTEVHGFLCEDCAEKGAHVAPKPARARRGKG